MDLQPEEINDLHERFVVDHTAFVEEWTKRNMPSGNAFGASTLAAGLGASAGIFCVTISKKIVVGIGTLRTIVIKHINKDLK